jgi:prepilin-type N-terminal cleavage/methylation domain-containing protein
MARRCTTQIPRSQAGLTLTEVLVAIVIFGIVCTMLVTSWIDLNRASAFAVQNNDAQATARDALSRMAVELRDAQPRTMPTATPSPLPTPYPYWSVLTAAQPMEVDFYSAYNVPSAVSDGNGGEVLTRIYLDTGGTSAQKTLYLARDTNGDGVVDRTTVLARDVVNGSIPNAGVTPRTPYTALFTYGYRDASGDYLTTDNASGTLDLTKIISIQIHLIIDCNLAHAPNYIDMTMTVRPRNAGAS